MTAGIQQRRRQVIGLRHKAKRLKALIPEPRPPKLLTYAWMFPRNFQTQIFKRASPDFIIARAFLLDKIARHFHSICKAYSWDGLVNLWKPSLSKKVLQQTTWTVIGQLYIPQMPLAAPPRHPTEQAFGVTQFTFSHIYDAAQLYLAAHPTLASSNVTIFETVTLSAATLDASEADAEEYWITNLQDQLQPVAPSTKDLRGYLDEAKTGIIYLDDMDIDFHRDLFIQAARIYFETRARVSPKHLAKIMDAATPKEALMYQPGYAVPTPVRTLPPQRATFWPNPTEKSMEIWKLYVDLTDQTYTEPPPSARAMELVPGAALNEFLPHRNHFAAFVRRLILEKELQNDRLRTEWWENTIQQMPRFETFLPIELKTHTATTLLYATRATYPLKVLAVYFKTWENLWRPGETKYITMKEFDEALINNLHEFDLMTIEPLSRRFDEIFHNIKEEGDIPWVRPTAANVKRIRDALFELLPKELPSATEELITSPMVSATTEAVRLRLREPPETPSSPLATVNKALIATTIIEAIAATLIGRKQFIRALTPQQRQIVDAVEDPQDRAKLTEYLRDMNQLIYVNAKNNLPYDPDPTKVTFQNIKYILRPDSLTGSFRINNDTEYPLIFRCQPDFVYTFDRPGYIIIDAHRSVIVNYRLIVPAYNADIEKPPWISIQNFVNPKTLPVEIRDPGENIPRKLFGKLTFLDQRSVPGVPYYLNVFDAHYRFASPHAPNYFRIRNDTTSTLQLYIKSQDKNLIVAYEPTRKDTVPTFPAGSTFHFYATVKKPPKRQFPEQEYVIYNALVTCYVTTAEFLNQWVFFVVPVGK